jgi:hypothetical protein
MDRRNELLFELRIYSVVKIEKYSGNFVAVRHLSRRLISSVLKSVKRMKFFGGRW